MGQSMMPIAQVTLPPSLVHSTVCLALLALLALEGHAVNAALGVGHLSISTIGITVLISRVLLVSRIWEYRLPVLVLELFSIGRVALSRRVLGRLMDKDDKKPSWLPSWVPEHSTLKFTATTLQVLILGMAFGFLLYHLIRGKVDTAVGILGNQAT